VSCGIVSSPKIETLSWLFITAAIPNIKTTFYDPSAFELVELSVSEANSVRMFLFESVP
jgi:hypothetical protein